MRTKNGPFKNIAEVRQYDYKQNKLRKARFNKKPVCADDGKNKKLSEVLQ